MLTPTCTPAGWTPPAWLAGGWIGLELPGEPALPLLCTLSFTLVGLLVALQLRLGGRMVAILGLLMVGWLVRSR